MGLFKNYVILLGWKGRSPKDYIRLQEGSVLSQIDLSNQALFSWNVRISCHSRLARHKRQFSLYKVWDESMVMQWSIEECDHACIYWPRGSCLSWLWLSWECNCWYQMVNKLRWRFKIISCIVTVRKISMPVMITSVVKSNPNDNFELSATTIVKMMEITICFLILFFKACWHAINLDNSADRVTSITLKFIFWYQEQY